MSTTSSRGPIVDDDNSSPQSQVFECHICMELPSDPVATLCGHVYCWPCIQRWLGSGWRPCPVCNCLVQTKYDILPLHGGGSGTGSSDGDHGGDSNSTVDPPRPSNPLLLIHHDQRSGDGSGVDLDKPGYTPEWKTVGVAVREWTKACIAHNHAKIEMELLQADLSAIQEESINLALANNEMRNHLSELQMQVDLQDQQAAS